jgi:hypothetical protein
LSALRHCLLCHPRLASTGKLCDIHSGLGNSFRAVENGPCPERAATIFAEIEKVIEVKGEMIVLIQAATTEERGLKIEELMCATGG